MEDSNSDDLPAGWTVEVKVRNNGKIDKYYTPPSSRLKFNSKVEVFRYLEKKAQKASNQRISENVEVEEGIAEELPPGSMKKTGITRSKDTIRRDSSVEGITMKQTLSVSLDQSSGFQGKNKRKKEADLPRRASKRLAGIKVDQFPEIQTRSRARHNATKQSGEEETITDADKSANSSSSDLAKQLTALDGSETMSKSDANIDKNTVEERVLENEDKVDVKRDYKLNFPLKELLSDPCLAFAIQTLTGVTFEIAKEPQISSEFKISQQCETSASAEDRGKEINPPGDDVANENAGSSTEKKTLDTSWMDPCMEFAIKTLTSPTIQLDSDQNPKTCFQQQLSSSNSQQHSEMANFGTQKPMLNQSFEDPTQQHARNIGIGNSTGAIFPHCGENRSNVC